MALCHRGFLRDAESAAALKGMPGVRRVSLNVPFHATVMAEIEAGVAAAMDDIIAALTRPADPDEASPQRRAPAAPPRVVFRGSLEQVNRFFYQQGWGDGLPLIPPTEEAVAEMLTGTDLPPNHVVAEIIPRGGKATVEKIAINAVMAGALPTYMPLLIAGVQLLTDPRTAFGTFEVSTGSWAPCWIINGPIRKQLNINCGSGMLSPGDIANAAIGRAMGLIIKNIGGARKGIEDMGVYGNPGKYTLVVAENEEDSPWAPLHVEHGLRPEDSAISVFFPNTFVQAFPHGSDDQAILDTVVSELTTRGLFCLLLVPDYAAMLAKKGWSKRDIAAFIIENMRVMKGAPLAGVPVQPDPDWVRVVVAGGPGAFVGMLRSSGPAFGAAWFSRPVQLPANWEQLVAKYQNVVPTYIRY